MGLWGDLQSNWRDYYSTPEPSSPFSWGSVRRFYDGSRPTIDPIMTAAIEEHGPLEAPMERPGFFSPRNLFAPEISAVSALRNTISKTPEVIGGAAAEAGRLLGTVNPRLEERHPGIARVLSAPGRFLEEQGATLEDMGARAGAQEAESMREQTEALGLSGNLWKDLRENPAVASQHYLGKTAGSLAGSIGTAVAAGMTPGSMLLGIGEQYSRARTAGQDRGEALIEAVPTGAAIGALEKIGLEKILSPNVASKILPRLRSGLAGMTAEGLTEGAQAFVSDLGATVRGIQQGEADASALGDLFSPENLSQYGAEAFLGGIAGGGVSLVTGSARIGEQGAIEGAEDFAAERMAEAAVREGPPRPMEPPVAALTVEPAPMDIPTARGAPAGAEGRVEAIDPLAEQRQQAITRLSEITGIGVTDPTSFARNLTRSPNLVLERDPDTGNFAVGWRTDPTRPADVTYLPGVEVRAGDRGSTGEARESLRVGLERAFGAQEQVAPETAPRVEAQEDLFEPAPGAIDLAQRGFLGRLQGPVGWLFGSRRAPLKTPTTRDVRSAFDTVEERWQAARGVKTVGMLKRMTDGIRNAVGKLPRTWADLDPNKSPQHARTADALRRVIAAESAAASKAFDEIDYITRDSSPYEGELFTRMLVLPDIAKDVEAGLYEGKELPFGYADLAAMQTDMARFEQMATPAVREALNRRQRIAENVARRMVDAKLLPEEILTDPRYYHRQVMAYMDGNGRLHEGRRGVRTTRRGFQRTRVGGGDFNTRYVEAEFEWLADAYELLAKHQALTEMRSDLDILPKLKEQAKAEVGKWQDHVPEGYTIWQPQPGNRFYRALTVTESELEKWFEKMKQAKLIDPAALEELETREAMVLGGSKEQWVVPEDIAATLDAVGKSDAQGDVARAYHRAFAAWKQWTLINPLRVLKYNLNNMSGDLDIAFAVDPGILKKVPKAFRMVWAYHMGRNPTPALRKYMNELESLGVINSGWTLHEVEDLGKEGMLRAFTEKRPNVLKRTVQNYWTNARAFTTARENVLRIAAYERALGLQAKGKDPVWVSRPKQVRAIADPKRRAAKLAREAIGDYGDISQSGRFIRRNLSPFYSWMEVNAPRYVRLFQNAVTEAGGKAAAARYVGARAASLPFRAVASAALSPVKTAALSSFLYAMVQLWNHTMFPEEDEEMRKSRTRREPHLILGRTDDGEIRSIRFEGAFADALEWFNLKDLPADVRDIREGRKSLADLAAEAAKGIPERLIQSVGPHVSLPVELLAGKSSYPRIFEEGTSLKPAMRPIYDKPGAVASALSLTPIYEAVTGKPGRRGSLVREFRERGLAEGLHNLPAAVMGQTLTYVTDPGEAAYWDTKSMIRDWLQEQGKETPTGFEKSKRGMALYYWKKAKQYGDERAEKKYRDRYIELGGTRRGMEQSIRMSGPLGGMSEENRRSFLATLSPEERERLEDAWRWYQGVFR